MIDHVALYVTDLEGSRRFDERALEPLGYAVSAEMEGFVGFAHEGFLRLALAHRTEGEYYRARRVPG
jgi:catechol 2,3-dioxygenase-like lactoylglutathione lyase family enzyme